MTIDYYTGDIAKGKVCTHLVGAQRNRRRQHAHSVQRPIKSETQGAAEQAEWVERKHGRLAKKEGRVGIKEK